MTLIKKIKKEIIEKGVSLIKHGDSKFRQKQYEYPITYQLIKDGRKNKVLSKKINLKINVTMFHGQKDEVVPVSFSRRVSRVNGCPHQLFHAEKRMPCAMGAASPGSRRSRTSNGGSRLL